MREETEKFIEKGKRTIVENGVVYWYLTFGGLVHFLTKKKETFPLGEHDITLVGQTHVGTQPVLLIRFPVEMIERTDLEHRPVEGLAIPIKDLVRLISEWKEASQWIRPTFSSVDGEQDPDSQQYFETINPLCCVLWEWTGKSPLHSLVFTPPVSKESLLTLAEMLL